MRTSCQAHMIALASISKTSFGESCVAAQEVGIIVPSILKANLEKHAYKVKETKMKVLTKVEVFLKDTLVAMGMSHDAGDALLQAIYAELKTEH